MQEDDGPGPAQEYAPQPPPAAAVEPKPPRPTHRVLHAFSASEAWQLSVSAGERVEVVEQDSDGWCAALVGRSQGTVRGRVPSAYLEPCGADSPDEEIANPSLEQKNEPPAVMTPVSSPTDMYAGMAPTDPDSNPFTIAQSNLEGDI